MCHASSLTSCLPTCSERGISLMASPEVPQRTLPRWLEYRMHFKKGLSETRINLRLELHCQNYHYAASTGHSRTYCFSYPVSVNCHSTDDTVCLHVNAIYVIKGSPIVQHKRLATYFTKETVEKDVHYAQWGYSFCLRELPLTLPGGLIISQINFPDDYRLPC